jgi:hypothetical protein
LLIIEDRAQRPGGQSGVKAVIGEGQRLAVEAGALHWDARGVEAVGSESPSQVGGFDRGDTRNLRRVKGDVVSRAEPDFDDVSR